MILVNMLLIVALAAGILALMISSQDAAFERSIRLREAAQADADAEGGILSAIVALRRDAVASPGNDGPSESWAKIGDQGSAIRGSAIRDGRFQLAIADAQGRFNVNTLAPGGTGSRALFAEIAAKAGLAPATTAAIATLLAAGGPIAEVGDLRRAGVGDGDMAALAAMVTALPATATTLNLNALDQPLLGLVLGNDGAARQLIDERRRLGILTPESLSRARVIAPPGTGYSSSFYWVRARVAIGDSSQQRTALLQRRATRDGIEVVPVARWRGAAVPPEAPALPENDGRPG